MIGLIGPPGLKKPHQSIPHPKIWIQMKTLPLPLAMSGLDKDGPLPHQITWHLVGHLRLKIPPMMMLSMSKTWNSPHYSVCFSPDILKRKSHFKFHRKYEHVCQSKNGTLTEYPLWRGWSTLPLRGQASLFSVVFPLVKKRDACSWLGKSKRLRRCCLDP